jgi:hypothetical protein
MKKATILILVVLALLVFATSALAMSSANYRLDWFTPLNSNGGGEMDSANYAANVTIGQTVIGSGSSANYRAGLGYWQGIVAAVAEWFVHLPLITK